jgi:S1-C subfamily serine protease
MKAFRLVTLFAAATLGLMSVSCGHLRSSGPPPAPPRKDVTSRQADLAHLARNRLATFRVDIVPRGHGSGIVVSKEGHIVTAYHVVDDAKRLEIIMVEADGSIKTYEAKVTAVDKANDLAVIKVEARFTQPAVLAKPEDIHPGDAVYNIGYPHDFGEMIGRGGVMRTGWNEDFDDTKVRDAVLVDVKDGAGTSGSGVFDANSGKVIGILTLKVWVDGGRTPATVVNALQNIKYVRQMLENAKIPYLSEFEDSAAERQCDPALKTKTDALKLKPGDRIIKVAPLNPLDVPKRPQRQK